MMVWAKQIGLVVFLLLVMGGCTVPGGGGSARGGIIDVVSSSFLGAAIINTDACILLQAQLLNEDGAVITATEDIPFLVTTTGAANIYEDQACTTINPNVVLEKEQSTTPIYIKGPRVETVMLEYNDEEVGEIEITTLSDQIPSSINGPVYSIELMNTDQSGFYIGGSFTAIDSNVQNYISRLRANGELDLGFTMTGTGLSGRVRKLLLQDTTTDNIVVAGDWQQINGSIKKKLACISASGLVDDLCNPDGGFDGDAHAVVIDNSGRLYVGGSLVRWNAPSTLTPGLTRFDGPAMIDAFLLGNGFGNGLVKTLLIDESDGIYVGGSFNAYNSSPYSNVIKLVSDGAVDRSFNVGAGCNGDVNVITPHIDETLYLAGAFTTFKGGAQNRLVRVDQNGNKDTSFDIGSGFNGEVLTVAVASDGGLYVGGNFTSYQGTAVGRIVKLLEDGSIDSTFDAGSGFNASVRVIKIPNDYSGDIWVGGDFTSYQSQVQNHLVRLNSVGDLD